MDRIAEKASSASPIQARDLLYWYSFDFMGSFVFSQDFGQLCAGKWNENILKLRKGLTLLGIASPVPWAAVLAFKYFFWAPWVRDWFCMLNFCKGIMAERVRVSSKNILPQPQTS